MATVLIEARQEFVEKDQVSLAPSYELVWLYNVGSWNNQTLEQAKHTLAIWLVAEKDQEIALAFARAFGFTTLEVTK